jgi:hypothetical protein
MSKLFFTVAVPRAGKSTYAEKWASEKAKRVIVCSDNIRLALHGQRYAPLAETMVFGIKHVMVRAHLDRGFDVLVDGTHTSDISIQRLLEIRLDAQPIFFFDVPKTECIARAMRCNQMDVIPAIERTYNNLMKVTSGIDYTVDPKWATERMLIHIEDIRRRVRERTENIIIPK